MRKIFILKGKGDTGKTTKIKQIAEWIINNYGASKSMEFEASKLEKDIIGVLTVGNLTIGINSAGDNLTEVKRLDTLKDSDGNQPNIILCASHIRDKGKKHIVDNYNYTNGWLQVFINVEEYSITDITKQTSRDARILDELKTWLIGLQKL